MLAFEDGPNTPVITAPFLALTGNQVLLNCSSSSHPPSEYRWSFNGTEMANTAEYLTGPLAFNMSGMYTCMAFNNVTGRNSTASHMLTVLGKSRGEGRGVFPQIQRYRYLLKCIGSGRNVLTRKVCK